MPEEAEHGGERTETATPRKRQDARKKGNVAKSQEINSTMILLAGALLLYFLAPNMMGSIGDLIKFYFGNAFSFGFTPPEVYRHSAFFLWNLFSLTLPIFLVLVVVGILVNVMQIGLVVNEEALVPKFDRLNPIPKIKNIFSKRGLAELLKSLLKIALVGYVCYRSIFKDMSLILSLTDADISTQVTVIGMLAFKITMKAILVMLFLAILDYAFQRYSFEESIRMTKQELKQEMKEHEGDPQIRARVRSIQREMARQRMMKEVPTAQVVVTNPTHLAIALSYDPEIMDAPRVVAKGRGFIARKIREIAEENKVPIVEDPPLAQALFKAVEIGMDIPGDFFQAVAEVLAYVFKLKKPKSRPSLQPRVTPAVN